MIPGSASVIYCLHSTIVTRALPHALTTFRSCAIIWWWLVIIWYHMTAWSLIAFLSQLSTLKWADLPSILIDLAICKILNKLYCSSSFPFLTLTLTLTLKWADLPSILIDLAICKILNILFIFLSVEERYVEQVPFSSLAQLKSFVRAS